MHISQPIHGYAPELSTGRPEIAAVPGLILSACKSLFTFPCKQWNPAGQPNLRRPNSPKLPPDVEYKDTTGYFGIYLNKPSWWALRIVAGARKPWVGFNIDPEAGQELMPAGFNRLSPHFFAEFRVGFQEPGDLVKLKELIVASFEKTISDRRS